MSSVARVADPTIRSALLDAAAGLIAAEGPTALTLRRLADAVGTSTMAIYTHFGSMDEVRREMRREGFARLSQHLSTVEDSGDPVADLILLGWQYYRNATTHSHMYRVMFMERPIDAADAVVGIETFNRLVRGVQRCIDARRFHAGDATDLATPLWALNHGVVTLQLAGMLTAERALASLRTGGANQFKAAGDDVRATGRSFTRARQRVGFDPLAAR